MTLLERIPTLSDEEVVNLLANARRLSDAEGKQQAAAAELLPSLEEEAEKRRQARLERAKAKRAASRRPRVAVA